MNRQGAFLPLLLIASVLPITGGATTASAEDATAASSSTFETRAGNTVDVERTRIEGEAGGRAVRRDVTVTNPDGEMLGQGRNVRYETAEGDRGRVNGRRWTDAEGNTHSATRAARRTEDGDVDRRRARTVRNENGEVQRRRVDRAHRDADGSGAVVTRRAGQSENGRAASRRVIRSDDQGQRTVRRQRVVRPNS